MVEMAIDIFLETGFLIALNPRDKNHDWALKILEEGSRGWFNIYISPVSLLELTLILRSRGVKDQDIALAMEAIEYAIKKYVKPNYPPLDIATNIYARG